jgi:hypothetical protein
MLRPVIGAARNDILHQRIGARLLGLGVLMQVNGSSDARQLSRACAPMGEPQDAVFLYKLLRHHEPSDGDLDVMALDTFHDRALDKHAALDLGPYFALCAQSQIEFVEYEVQGTIVLVFWILGKKERPLVCILFGWQDAGHAEEPASDVTQRVIDFPVEISRRRPDDYELLIRKAWIAWAHIDAAFKRSLEKRNNLLVH